MSLLMLTTACATVLAQKDGSDILTVLMLPGLWTGLLVTGGHGGTPLRETVGTVVAVAVNMLLVAMPFLLIALLFRELRSESERA
jgi:hypothetical protein